MFIDPPLNFLCFSTSASCTRLHPWRPKFYSAAGNYTGRLVAVFLSGRDGCQHLHPDATTRKWSTGEVVARSGHPMPRLRLLYYFLEGIDAD
jgi:hypothetical protein